MGDGGIYYGISGSILRHALTGQHQDIGIADLFKLGIEGSVIGQAGGITIIPASQCHFTAHGLGDHIVTAVTFGAAIACPQTQQARKLTGTHDNC